MSTPWRSSQAAYSPKSAPTGADQDRLQAETAQAKTDVGGDPSSTYFQFVDEEGQGDLGELVGDELVGEPALQRSSSGR